MYTQPVGDFGGNRAEFAHRHRLAEDFGQFGLAIGLYPLEGVVDVASLERTAPVDNCGAVGGVAMSLDGGNDHVDERTQQGSNGHRPAFREDDAIKLAGRGHAVFDVAQVHAPAFGDRSAQAAATRKGLSCGACSRRPGCSAGWVGGMLGGCWGSAFAPNSAASPG